MELARFLVLMITSLVLVLHHSCALAAHYQGRKLKGNSEDLAPAKMGLVHHHFSSGALGGSQHQWKYQNGKGWVGKTRYLGEKKERNVNSEEEANEREVMNMMRRDYGPRGRSPGRRKPPINNHNHKH